MRKAPWHSPSECSFDYGYRIGRLAGQISVLKACINHIKKGDEIYNTLRKKLAKMVEKQRTWQRERV